MCTLYFVVFVDKRHGVSWETQCLIAAAVRLRTKPTHTPAPYSTLGPIPRLAMAVKWGHGWVRGPHPAPDEQDRIVKTTKSGYDVWFCNLCHNVVTSDNGRLDSNAHEKRVEWHKSHRPDASPAPTQADPHSRANLVGPPAAASKRSAAPASPTSGAASANGSASSMVVDVGAALAPATAHGDTIRIELPWHWHRIGNEAAAGVTQADPRSLTFCL